MRSKLLSMLALALPLFAITPAHADAVSPLSYTIDQPTACGSYCYYDSSARELIDGQFGRAGWAVDLGHGNAQEWVGFYNTPRVNIDFSFGASSSISGVSIGSTQDVPWDVTLPSIEVYQKLAGNWVLAGQLTVPVDMANNRDAQSLDAHTFLNLSGLNIHSDQVRVSMVSNGPWTFTDEVSFTSPVPEPESCAMLLAGLGLLGLTARRKQASVQ